MSLSSTLRSRHNARSVRQNADNTLLAHLGYKPEFRREFSMFETIAFAFSIMGVCSALSATFWFPLVAGGHVGMTFGWLVPSLFVLCVVSSLAELTSAMPTSAGIYYFAAKLAPEKHMPLISWIAGWSNVTGQIALLCSIEYTAAQMVTTAIAVGTDGNVNLGLAPTYGIMLAFLFSHAIVCSAATRVIARMTFVYAFVYVGTTIGAGIALLVVSRNNGVTASEAFGSLENNTGWTNNGWAFLLSFSDAMWTLTGYDAAAHIAEEVSGAAWSSPIAMVVGVAATEVLGFFLLIGMSFSTTSVSRLLATSLSLPAGQLFLDAFGKTGMLVLWTIMMTIQWINGVTQGIDASRVTFALARDNGLPGSRWLKIVSRRTDTPVNAVWFVMFMSAVIGLFSLSATALASLSGAAVVGLYSSYAIPIFLRVTSGRKRFKPGPFSLGRFSVPIGITAVSYCLFVVVFMSFPFTQQIRQASDMNFTFVIVAAVFIFSALSWVISARWWFTGPVPNIDTSESETKAESLEGKEKEAEVNVTEQL
ncbi:hypothetical protein M378DRAFT_172402 [Amanita muscaria Koide BX008]|uniref:Amino acid transporter n=1 Tax=Amanita muscaria (strain Koide BX008) TaxID=946122 RepID=A0A0C2W6L6_AMAMK|nr:hypothetical protein M378DRAFT_172402 [Amanita muscaria Koide BX008]